jgi:hypothetical protein
VTSILATVLALAGRPLSSKADPTVLDDLHRLVEPATMGDPMRPLAVGVQEPREAGGGPAGDEPCHPPGNINFRHSIAAVSWSIPTLTQPAFAAMS